MILRNRIMMAAIEEISNTGIRFTMEELAGRLVISKKTLYVHFASKEELIGAIIDSFIDRTRQLDEEILNSATLNVSNKVKALLINEIEVWQPMGNSFFIALRRKYPEIWRIRQLYRQTKWQLIESLLIRDRGIDYISPIDSKILKAVLTTSVNELLNPKFLVQNKLALQEAAGNIVNMIYFGLSHPAPEMCCSKRGISNHCEIEASDW